MNEQTLTLVTYGKNKGQDVVINGHRFIKGRLELSAGDAEKASKILCRYHDVCFEHELKDKVKETKPKKEKVEKVPVKKTDTPAIPEEKQTSLIPPKENERPKKTTKNEAQS
nr:hypothetical protein 16 [bacterium]